MSATRDKGYRGMGMEGFVARWYARNTGRSMEEFRAAARKLAAQVPGGRVLEVAPGPGYFAIELAKLGDYQITGLDISKTFVDLATKNATAAGVAVTFRQGNASVMPFESDSFDVIFCRAAFKNFSDPVGAMREMYRVLKRGGWVVIVDLRRDATPAAIREAVKGMNLSRINAWLTRLTFKHVLLKRAYTPDDMRWMASETPFGPCEIDLDSIGMEVTLKK
jgi:ubiquinone/menaquinone biosynthesis C-methylase UbiE